MLSTPHFIIIIIIIIINLTIHKCFSYASSSPYSYHQISHLHLLPSPPLSSLCCLSITRTYSQIESMAVGVGLGCVGLLSTPVLPGESLQRLVGRDTAWSEIFVANILTRYACLHEFYLTLPQYSLCACMRPYILYLPVLNVTLFTHTYIYIQMCIHI